MFRVSRLARGTWLQSEAACYPTGAQLRRGRALFPDGKVRAVYAGVADSYWTVPAHARVAGRYVAGFVYVADAACMLASTSSDRLPMADTSTAEEDTVYAFRPTSHLYREGGWS